MLDTVLGLPTHPLLVHGAVVLLPLVAVLVAYASWRPARWRGWAPGLTAAAAVVLVLTWLAKESGEKFIDTFPQPTALMETHEEVAESLPVYAGAVLMGSLVLLILSRNRYGDRYATSSALTRAVSLATTVIALLAIVWTVRAGHSGAEAVWKPVAGG